MGYSQQSNISLRVIGNRKKAKIESTAMRFKLAMEILLAASAVILVAQVNGATTDPQVPDYAQRQIQWLKSKKGGFFSSKITYTNPDDTTSLSGMYALAPIAKGEEIIHIPADALLTTNHTDFDNDNDGLPTNKLCNAAWNLAEERRKGKESLWEPYVTYCFETFPHEKLPAKWSDEALELFYDIIGEELEPQYFGDRGSYEEYCGYDEDEERDDTLEAAYRIVISRGWTDVFVPLLDMINHRNGKWYNADQAGSAHTGEDISVAALRDIEEGEQIYNSYNECPDTDCHNIRLTFATPEILSDYGFVEQYPRRFNIAADKELDLPVFEVDMDEDGEVGISWLNGEPDEDDIEWFREQLERLVDLEEEVKERLEELESHEQYTINAYYNAVLEGLELAVSWDDEDEYEALENYADQLVYHGKHICPSTKFIPAGNKVYSEADESRFQHIEFSYFDDDEGNKLDTCLRLDGWIHMCNSMRPHYHEWFVDYPAQFLKQVKRVLFLGGGDNMILHEVLKYPELELVVGMELEQIVVRSSFKHFKTQPHFDDSRVQWWFGDAAKSLKMLPDEYLGTFDLVVIDLITYVTEFLMVTDELSILDFCLLLLNEGGILTMNEEFIKPTKATDAQYTVDLEVRDVPIFCQMSINMLSNTVDFMTAKPIDHGVESLVVTPGVTKTDSQKFESWWNYHRNVHHKLKGRKAATVDASDNTQGIMTVLEAEDISLSMNSMTDIKDTITKSLQQVGLTILSSSSFETKVLTIALKEGYVMIRCWSEHKYIAFDLVLWSSLDKLDIAKSALVDAVGAKSISSYNIVLGGMRGVEKVEIAKYPTTMDSNTPTCSSDDTTTETAFAINDNYDVLLREMDTLLQSNNPVTIVFCPEKDKPCHSLESLKYDETSKTEKVFPVWSCASGDSMEVEGACEKTTLDAMKSALASGKINRIIIDPETPRKMGHVLREVLEKGMVQKQVLAEHYVVLAPAFDSDETWRSALCEWLRTDAKTTYPVYHAEVLFSTSKSPGKLGMSIFSAGDIDFFSHLAEAIEQYTTLPGLVVEIPSIQGGKHEYMEDVDPSHAASESSYDKTPAESQWASQNSLGMQTVTQFEIKIPPAPLRVGDKVLAQYFDHPLVGRWSPGTVRSLEKDGSFDVEYVSGIVQYLERDSIRKWDIARDISASEIVLVRHGEDSDDRYVGKVLEKLPNNEYKVHVHNGQGLVITAKLEDMMKRFEEPGDKIPQPGISCTILKEMLQTAIVSEVYDTTLQDEKLNVEIHDGAGDGCVVTALWSQGNAVAIWDGGHHIDLNVFTLEEDDEMHEEFGKTFLEMASSFEIVMVNEQPRGTGRVVNFKNEMKSVA